MELIKSPKKGGFLSPFWSDLFNNERFLDSRLSLMESVFPSPPANVIENGNYFKIELAVPGFSKEDFTIGIDNNVLSISADKEEEFKKDEGHYTRKEFRYESFERSFTLPEICDDTKIDANYKEGILSLKIPKKESEANHPKKEVKIK